MLFQVSQYEFSHYFANNIFFMHTIVVASALAANVSAQVSNIPMLNGTNFKV